MSLVLDLSATPWYGSGSPKPEGTLFEWLVSDFSVYDAFESGLVKVVRLPDPDEHGRVYLDLWDLVKGAKTKEEYLASLQGRDREHLFVMEEGLRRVGSFIRVCPRTEPGAALRGRQRPACGMAV